MSNDCIGIETRNEDFLGPACGRSITDRVDHWSRGRSTWSSVNKVRVRATVPAIIKPAVKTLVVVFFLRAGRAVFTAPKMASETILPVAINNPLTSNDLTVTGLILYTEE